MLKPQDCAILLKLLAKSDVEWSQRKLAQELAISLSEINSGIKRLAEAGLVRKSSVSPPKFIPILSASEEFLIHSVKYLFPVKLGEYTRGVPTSIAAPLFKDKIAYGNDPIPVWPDAHGEQQGVALDPIYGSIPKALREYPDPNFYDLLVLVDTIRQGRARERNLAIQLLKERLKYENQ